MFFILTDVSWLKEQFKRADKDNDRFLTLDEVLQILNQMNISMNKKHAKALFDVWFNLG